MYIYLANAVRNAMQNGSLLFKFSKNLISLFNIRMPVHV